MVEEMNKQFDDLPPQTRIRCMTPEIRKVGSTNKPVAYFQHMDYDERTPPSEPAADLMCRTNGVMCPLAEQCLKLGLALDVDHGVWGGRTIVDGQDYYQQKEKPNG